MEQALAKEEDAEKGEQVCKSVCSDCLLLGC